MHLKQCKKAHRMINSWTTIHFSKFLFASSNVSGSCFPNVSGLKSIEMAAMTAVPPNNSTGSGPYSTPCKMIHQNQLKLINWIRTVNNDYLPKSQQMEPAWSQIWRMTNMCLWWLNEYLLAILLWYKLSLPYMRTILHLCPQQNMIARPMNTPSVLLRLQLLQLQPTKMRRITTPYVWNAALDIVRVICLGFQCPSLWWN